MKKILPAFVLVFLLAACGGVSKPVTEIKLEATDFAFNPLSATVPVGKPITVTVKNDGSVEHDFVIAKINVADVVTEGDGMDMGHDMSDMGHDMGDMEYDLHISTPVGETSALTFTPTEAGEYEFFCSVPGHKEAGMIGKLIVVEE
ncbi:MAG: hypothetical protein MHPDNHAH_01590 [Anaerolineales bacterium]|nr:hypothetical protein [Anaerolineales bacterium]